MRRIMLSTGTSLLIIGLANTALAAIEIEPPDRPYEEYLDPALPKTVKGIPHKPFKGERCEADPLRFLGPVLVRESG